MPLHQPVHMETVAAAKPSPVVETNEPVAVKAVSPPTTITIARCGFEWRSNRAALWSSDVINPAGPAVRRLARELGVDLGAGFRNWALGSNCS